MWKRSTEIQAYIYIGQLHAAVQAIARAFYVHVHCI